MEDLIIKAIKAHAYNKNTCEGCYLNNTRADDNGECIDILFKAALDIIARKSAKLEELQDYINQKLSGTNDLIKAYDTESAKAEAVKEFAEMYRDHIKSLTGMFTDDGFYIPLDAALSAIDFISEKMGAEDDG